MSCHATRRDATRIHNRLSGTATRAHARQKFKQYNNKTTKTQQQKQCRLYHRLSQMCVENDKLGYNLAYFVLDSSSYRIFE